MAEVGPELEAALAAGQTVVVPTAQRAVALRLGFATWQLAKGRRAFRTPEIHSLSGWLRGQPRWGPQEQPLRQLGAHEEWLLWREAVAEAAARLSLPSAAGLVDAVQRSAALLFEWQIAPQALLEAATPESLLLATALKSMDARLADLSAAASWSALQELTQRPPPSPPLLAGFAAHSPARRALLAAWARRGGAALELSDTAAAAPASIAHCNDAQEELLRVAQWCRERLRIAPRARLLVIVPELARRQAEIRRVFDAVLDPQYLQRAATQPDAAVYALEGAQPLLNFAPIAAGLRTLRVLLGDVEQSESSHWLRGGSWPQPPAPQRAQLEVWLRTVVPPRLNAGQLLQALRSAPPPLLAAADQVAALINRARQAAVGSRATLAEWSGRFAQILSIFEVSAAAPRQHTSHTQQVLQRLDELFQECAALSAAFGQFSAAGALALFTQLLARTRFEPASGDVAITLSASLADPILRYDGIWASGLHAGAIPEQARFDPFIPAVLQRRAGMLAADAAALVGQAQQQLATLCRSSPEFIVSAPAHQGDLALAAAPLLAPYATRAYAAVGDGGEVLPRILRTTRRMERYEDAAGLPWSAPLPLPSGTRAIELQSRCPFRAYAQLRLGAKPLESPVPGITPRERGRMLHRALELLWQRLGGSAGLSAAVAEQALSAAVTECVAQAGEEVLQGTDPGLEDEEVFAAAADATGLLELRRAAITRELARAERLIGALCELESARAPFFISELEAGHRLEIAGGLIDVRIDRIDRLGDGSHAILDYKTGRTVTADWEVERTTHPQLLVYQLAAGVPVSALAVAHLDPKNVGFRGIADRDSRLPGLSGGGDWGAQQAGWRQQVTQLAADFMRGHAAVEPRDRACDLCHLHAFCRIAEVAVDHDAEAAADSDATEPA